MILSDSILYFVYCFSILSSYENWWLSSQVHLWSLSVSGYWCQCHTFRFLLTHHLFLLLLLLLVLLLLLLPLLILLVKMSHNAFHIYRKLFDSVALRIQGGKQCMCIVYFFLFWNTERVVSAYIWEVRSACDLHGKTNRSQKYNNNRMC